MLLSKFILFCTLLMTNLITISVAADLTKEEIFDLERSKFEVKRKNTIESTLNLTDETGKKFWPLYHAYRAEVKIIDDIALSHVKDYAAAYNKGSVSNEQAALLLDEFLKIDQDRLELKAIYIEKFKRLFPATLVWRYFHTEDRLDTTLRFLFVNEVPLVK